VKKYFQLSVFLLFILTAGSFVLNSFDFFALLSPFRPIVPPAKSQQFILMADTGSGEPAQFAVAAAIQSHCTKTGECQAVFIAGDVIYEAGVKSVTDTQFQTKFELPYAQINLPFFISYGNHDYQGCKECYISYSDESQKWKMPSRYYLQSFGDDITFFVIDTENFDTVQQDWLSTALANSTAKHKLVVGHQPIETFEMTKVEETWQGKDELKKIICTSAEMYIAGHAHILEDNGGIGACPVRQLVVGGGGASIRELASKSDGGFLAAEHGFAVLTVVGDKMSYAFFNDVGEKLFDSVP
jgi:tartrate-resistant acid phosphatase type 5